MSKNQLAPAAFFLLASFFLSALSFQNKIYAQPPSPRAKYPVARPSNAAEAIFSKKRENPRLSAAALAAYGNALIRKNGFDFSLMDCAIAEANGKSGDDGISESETPFVYDFEILRGGKKTFQIMAKNWEAPCGCSFDVPVLHAGANQWTILAGGKPFVLKRPKDFYFEEVRMLDRTFKKTLRTFYKPLDNDVAGISADGTKIYTELSYEDDDGVMLEIAADGNFRIVPGKTANIIRKKVELTSEEMRRHDEASEIHHFKSGNKSYFLHYYAPCT